MPEPDPEEPAAGRPLEAATGGRAPSLAARSGRPRARLRRWEPPVSLPFKGHSILTGDELWADPKAKVEDPEKTKAANRALDETLALLRQKLKEGGESSPAGSA